eukprot:GHVT01101646.1.p1 GENE.GHVT01101646.1~~GHVT01101646.1.p1  ORF type:complete len:135 (+),score=12.44 GHVT01101646.1:60-464(+)
MYTLLGEVDKWEHDVHINFVEVPFPSSRVPQDVVCMLARRCMPILAAVPLLHMTRFTGCENVSDEFFQCLQSNLPPGDLVARDQALQECAVKQVAYEQCFRASLENKTLAAPRVWVDFKPQDDTEKFDCLKFHN